MALAVIFMSISPNMKKRVTTTTTKPTGEDAYWKIFTDP
jgi:hypothetical protein